MRIFVQLHMERECCVLVNSENIKKSSFFLLRIGLFRQKYQNFAYVSSGMYSITKCDNSGIKAVDKHANDDYGITRGR